MIAHLKVCPPITNEELNRLFASAWPAHINTDFRPMLERALLYVCAFNGEKLVGFAKVVSDGGIHGFLLDPTVSSDCRRFGIGSRLVQLCASEARRRGIEWLHVDFLPELSPFYVSCGFRKTEAGLRNLKEEAAEPGATDNPDDAQRI